MEVQEDLMLEHSHRIASFLFLLWCLVPAPARAQCDNGQVFAVFGPEVFALLERERNWASPEP